MNQLTITKPDDWHLHLRDEEFMQAVVNDSSRYFKRALIMPNLSPPVASVSAAMAYRSRICQASKNTGFSPKMAVYLTASTSVEEIVRIKNNEDILVVKMFPAGATTNSDAGIQHIDQCDAVFEKMQELGVPLSVHGEVTNPEVDIFDREKVFIDDVLDQLVSRYPDLKIVMEHLSTKEGVQYIQNAPTNLAATITIHHLVINRNNLLVGGLNPYNYCLPIVKSGEHQKELITAAVSGNPKFFLGTDSAPHARKDKENGSAKAGIYTAPVAIPLYLDLFEKAGHLDRFEAFASFYGADFYGLPRNREQITFQKSKADIPERIPYGQETLVPFLGGESVNWTISE